jgi:hypothetical protein
MGLGSFPVVTLKRAREKALEARRLLADGEDPLTHKRAARASLRQQHTKQLRALTFDQCAEQFIKSHSAGWRSVMHAKQWSQSLRDHVSPGYMSMDATDTESALKDLEPIWNKMSTAAGRVRNRIELILIGRGCTIARARILTAGAATSTICLVVGLGFGVFGSSPRCLTVSYQAS